MSHITEQGRKALEKVAAWLEAGAPHVQLENGLQVDHFNMEYAVQVEPGCGTVCCIAGAVCQFEGLGLANRDEDGSLDWNGEGGAFDLASDYLDISYEQSREMFCPWNSFSGDEESFNSSARGAAVIRYFLETGEVDWDRFDSSGLTGTIFEEE